MEKVTKIIKVFCAVAMIAFFALLFFVMFQNSSKPLKDTYITDSFKTAYQNNSDVRTHDIKDGFSENGAVYAYSLTYIPESGYLQFTVRYNNRHIDEIRQTHTDFKNEYISYVLIDGNGNEYRPNIIEEKEKFHYHYFKLEFTNVDFTTSDLTLRMVLDTLDFNGGELSIHTKDSTSIAYKFSSKEKKQL